MKQLLLVAMLGLLGGCQKTGAVAHTSTTLSYTPTGCAYEVKTPEVTEVSMGTDAKGASPTPGHVHVAWAGDPTSTFAVNWQTDNDTRLTQVLYGADQAAVTAADGAGAGVAVQQGHTLLYSGILDNDPSRVHEAHVCGLTPSTRYYYKVGGPGAWSKVYDVMTAPPKGSTGAFSFAVSGDARSGPDVWSRVQEAIGLQAVDFQIFSGDAVDFGPSQAEWNAFFEATTGTTAVTDVIARTPFMFCDGNHEALALNYLVQFPLPQVAAGDSGIGKDWYSFDHGNAHFVILNDTTLNDATLTGAEADFLRADLAAVDRTAQPWVIVAHHQPAYSCASAHGSNTNVRAAWQPIFDQFGVDLVFSGHDHDYERSRPIRGFQTGTTNGEIAASAANGVPIAGSGTIYVVAAGGGAPLYGVDSSCYHTLTTESTNNYVIVQIQDRTLSFTAYRIDGSTLDAFQYSK